MASLTFNAVIEILGVNPYVLVSSSRAKTLCPGWKKPMPVLIRIDGMPKEPWRINLMPKGNGSFYLYLHGNVRKASGTKVGDRVKVEIEFDKEYRAGPIHPIPEQFQDAVENISTVRTSWNALAPSRQKDILRYFAALKSTQALERNIRKMVHILSGNDSHFMGRDWKDGK